MEIQEIKTNTNPKPVCLIRNENNLIELLKRFVLDCMILKDPRNRTETAQYNFQKLTEQLTTTLEEIDEVQKAAELCFKFLEFFPNNASILDSLGVCMFRIGDLNEARKYLEKAVNLKHLPAEKNLLHVLWHMIPRWHFRILNDRKRNLAYYEAITKAVKEGYKHVYDIGSGSGLLSLIAAKCDENVTVTAYEENIYLGQISQEIFDKNNVNNIILNITNSTNLTKKIENILTKTLIVSEIFDVALIGEGALTSLSHAIKHFTDEKNFKIIPSNAQLYVTGINCNRLNSKFRLINNQIDELQLDNICLEINDSEAYDAEYIDLNDTSFLTETNEIFNINFANVNQLDNLLNDDHSFDIIELKCIETGEIQALAVWFDLNLDEVTKITTNPNDDCVNCWEQGIFHLKHSIYVRVNDIIKIQPKIICNKLSFDLLINDNTSSYNNYTCYKVSKETITLLNDKNLYESYQRAVMSFKDFNLRILELNHFPLFGLLMAKHGFNVYYMINTKNYGDLNLIDYIYTKNNLTTFHIISSADFKNLPKIDVICPDFIHFDGSWNLSPSSYDIINLLKTEIFPKKINLVATLIESDYLEFCNIVNDENVFKFKIGEFINSYTGSEHPALDNFSYESLTEPIKIDISDLSVNRRDTEVFVKRKGLLNGILYWFEFQLTADPGNVFSTNFSNYYSKSCTFLKKRALDVGDKFVMRVERCDNYLKVSCPEL